MHQILGALQPHCLLYGDALILMSTSPEGVQRQLEASASFSEQTSVHSQSQQNQHHGLNMICAYSIT